MKSKLLLLSLATIAVSACSTATMTKDECRTVDWRTVGYEDGVAGRSGEQIGAHRRACAEHGVTPDLAAYRAGRTEGLREFCQPHNGYRAGVTGVVYQDVCPEDLAAGFLVQYEAGRELYVHEQRVRDADAQLSAKRYEVTRLEDAVARSGFRVISETSTAEQRTQAVLDAKQYAERIGRLKSEIAQLEKDRARYAQELETYRATVASTN